MKIARFNFKDEVHFGVIEDSSVRFLVGEPFAGVEFSGKTAQLSEVKILAPVSPSKVICIGLNYSAHAAEISQDVLDEPLMFFKPSSAIIATGESIVLPSQSGQVELEIELAIVIGKTAKNISKAEVDNHVLGYTIGNDVTARDLQFSDLQWARSKGFDTFCPLGPWIETEFSHKRIHIESRVNGEKRQSANTKDMIFDVETIVSYVSQNVTLLPGDVILTGSPAGISKISRGDTVDCEIEGIGILSNPVT